MIDYRENIRMNNRAVYPVKSFLAIGLRSSVPSLANPL